MTDYVKPYDILKMHSPICSSEKNIIFLKLPQRAIGLSDISEFLQKNESRNISDFLQIDFSHLQHFGYISGTKSSTLFFLFTRRKYKNYFLLGKSLAN